MLIVQITENQF